MYSIIYYLILLYGFSVYSNELWMKAGNLEQFNQIIHDKQQQNYLKISCRIQLRKNKIPWACYEWIHQKKSSIKTKQNLISYFNEKCQTALINLNASKQILKALQNQHLSQFCRKILQEKKQTIEYQLRDRAPELLFNWYFKKEF